MPITKHFRNPKDFKKISCYDLQVEAERKLININSIRSKIPDLAKRKKDTFKAGINADPITRRMLIHDMNMINGELNEKYAEFVREFKEYQIISNLIVLKKHEKDVKVSPVLARIMKLSPEDFQSLLINVKLTGNKTDSLLESLNNALKKDLKDPMLEMSEEDQKIIDVWDSLRDGKMDAAEIDGMFSLDKEIEKNIEKCEI